MRQPHHVRGGWQAVRHGPASGQYGHDLPTLSSGVTSHQPSKELRTSREGAAGPGEGKQLVILTARCLMCRMQNANAGQHPQSPAEWKSFPNER